MKVVITNEDVSDSYIATNLSQIPRLGEYITIVKDSQARMVIAVIHLIYKDQVNIAVSGKQPFE